MSVHAEDALGPSHQLTVEIDGALLVVLGRARKAGGDFLS